MNECLRCYKIILELEAAGAWHMANVLRKHLAIALTDRSMK